MDDLIERQRQALELVESIIDLGPDLGTLAYARKMRERLILPMSVVMEALMPGASIADKVRRLGISQPTYYGWVLGKFRPNPAMAKKLAKLTGYNENEIRGQKSLWNNK
jgi:hypothetical protein